MSTKIVLFSPRSERSAAENVNAFIQLCKFEITTFGEDLNFDDNVWDITPFLSYRSNPRARRRLVFRSFAAIQEHAETPIREPWLSFAKAFLRYMHSFRPTQVIDSRMAALRCIDAAFSSMGVTPNPVNVDSHILNRAAQISVERHRMAAYTVGLKIREISSFLLQHRLTAVPTEWGSWIKRPMYVRGRIGKEFDEQRKKRLPSKAALESLPLCFRAARQPGDVIATAAAAILCSAPDRASEVLRLPVDCEVFGKTPDGREAYGLRWWPAKGAEPMVKWVVGSMSSVVREAVQRIKDVTAQARKVAAWYEEHPTEIFLERNLEYLRELEWITYAQVSQIIGLEYAAVGVWCRSKSLQTQTRGNRFRVRFQDVEKAIMQELPHGFPFLCRAQGLRYKDALFVTLRSSFHSRRNACPAIIDPISISRLNTSLGSSRRASGYQDPSVFTRLGFAEPDGSPIKITTHQFRHYLNTLAASGGLGELDIALWSGRKDVSHNRAYDHVTADEYVEKIRESVGDELKTWGPIGDLPVCLPLARRDFLQLRIPTAHTTELGFCIHDYTMSPCELHRDCINCEDLVCIKREPREERSHSDGSHRI